MNNAPNKNIVDDPVIQPAIQHNEHMGGENGIPQIQPEPEEIEIGDPELDNLPIAIQKPVRNCQLPKCYDGALSANVIEPATYHQAVNGSNSSQWHDAMLEEINAHLTNDTWSIIPLPPGKKAIGSRWVYRLKHNADGSIKRFKARLVAQGFSQRPGLNYLKTFASTYWLWQLFMTYTYAQSTSPMHLLIVKLIQSST